MDLLHHSHENFITFHIAITKYHTLKRLHVHSVMPECITRRKPSVFLVPNQVFRKNVTSLSCPALHYVLLRYFCQTEVYHHLHVHPLVASEQTSYLASSPTACGLPATTPSTFNDAHGILRLQREYWRAPHCSSVNTPARNKSSYISPDLTRTGRRPGIEVARVKEWRGRLHVPV